MSKPTTQTPPQGDDRNLVQVDENYLAPGFEDSLRLMWEKNRNLIIAVCVAVVAVIVFREVRSSMAARHQAEVAAAYAAAGTDSMKLRDFAKDNAGSPLAGAALLQVADDSYKAGQYGEAHSGYDKAAAALSGNKALAGRAAIGSAVSSVMAGSAADGETALKKIANDATQLAAVRSEAAYHVAVLAAKDSRNAEATQYADLAVSVMTKADPNAQSYFASQATALLAKLPVPAASTTTTVAPTTPAPAKP